MNRPVRATVAQRPVRRPSLTEWVQGLPGLSGRARRLLLEGDTEARYAGRTAADSGYRLTMALAVAVSQPGREWTLAQWWEALVLRPTAGGAWARSLRSRKGERYAESKLAGMLDKARGFVGTSGTIVCRADAIVAIARLRAAVEAVVWPGPGGGTDLKNLTARLQLAEQAGGIEHEVSVRQLAELMGCARSTVEASNARLRASGWLVLVTAGIGEHSSAWSLRIPPAGPEDQKSCARPGHRPASGERGAEGDPGAHTEREVSTRALGSVMGTDACHHYAHGTSGARILAALDPLDGADVAHLAAATGLHRTTVRRRVDKLVEDGLAEEADGLVYLPRHLAGGEGLRPDPDQLEHVALTRGTADLGERRRKRHGDQRRRYRQWLTERTQYAVEQRRPARPRLRLVPEGVVDESTGELRDTAWRGWIIDDPYRPTWPDDGSPEAVCE
ncbi:helix-turn-helix domain-containing protein [Streptomyces anulatus]|uniref:helix-turn-helix domain-containing protein n=1 Tax=Streptomyces anulatus TaxID=1892 RepID=UPI0004C5FAC9|nr:helix-turn-helix domain-containing protein [Streptomyces anulatus]